MANIDDATIVFPEYLRQNEFENRRVFINIVQQESFADGIQAVTTKLLTELTDMAGSIGNAMATDINKMEQNLRISDEKKHTGKTIFTVVLPLPNEFTDTQQHDWNTAKGITGTVLGGIENQSIDSFVFGSAGGGLANMAAGTAPVVGAGIQAGMGMEVQQALGAMSDSMGLRKPLADPGYFQNYTGSQPRTFNMTFDLVPSNPKEALDIMNIVMRLKEHSSPTVTTGVSLLAPNYFDIQLSNKWISAMAGLNGVVLQNMVVNYGADGNMQQFPDGTPKYIQIGLTFVERKMRTANDFKTKLAR
jgi:hypothetical protein